MYAALTKALTTALVELSRENTPASQEMIAFTTKELNTSVTYTSPTLMSTEQQKVVSPRSHSSKEEGYLSNSCKYTHSITKKVYRINYFCIL
jgi:hypothetical protein